MRESWLNDVLANDRLQVHYQPLVQFPPGRIHGYECLIRGVDAAGNLISPGRLFEAAATLDRLCELDEKCRAAALRAAAAMARPNLNFFINFLPSAVVHTERFFASLQRELDAGGLNPRQIVFEVVETDRVHDHRHLIKTLAQLRKTGFQVALDDVGAGYSSLLSLCRLRPDYIKLDGELVRRAAFSTLEAKMIADLAETARQNGIMTVAEGIETEQQLRLVLDCGIRLTQGYIHARPEPGLLGEPRLRSLLDRITKVAGERTRRAVG
jgi:EAL domain-containing protein (putative c-di-GMP-specific phosphodiesterase class I)